MIDSLYPHYTSYSPVMMVGFWIIQILIAWLIWRDAQAQKMLAPVWVILAIIPMFGLLSDLVYLVLREFRTSR